MTRREHEAWRERLVECAHQEADDREWCPDFDDFMADMGLPRRTRDYDLKVTLPEMTLYFTREGTDAENAGKDITRDDILEAIKPEIDTCGWEASEDYWPDRPPGAQSPGGRAPMPPATGAGASLITPLLRAGVGPASARQGTVTPMEHTPTEPALTPAAAETRAVARMLLDADYLSTAEEVLYFFGKPHKYQEEASSWHRAGRPEPEDPGWEMFTARLERHVQRGP